MACRNSCIALLTLCASVPLEKPIEFDATVINEFIRPPVCGIARTASLWILMSSVPPTLGTTFPKPPWVS